MTTFSVTDALLTDVLGRYEQYRQTASSGLRDLRAQFIPVVVSEGDRRAEVCRVSELVLGGQDWKPSYDALSIPEQLAVAFCVFEVWVLTSTAHVGNLDDLRYLSDRVLSCMQAIDLGYVFLALRNAAGGKETDRLSGKNSYWKVILWKTKEPSWMQLYLDIRSQKFGRIVST